MVRYCGDAMVVHPTTMGPWEKFWKCSARSIMAGAGRRAFHQRLWMRVVMQVCVCVCQCWRLQEPSKHLECVTSACGTCSGWDSALRCSTVEGDAARHPWRTRSRLWAVVARVCEVNFQLGCQVDVKGIFAQEPQWATTWHLNPRQHLDPTHCPLLLLLTLLPLPAAIEITIHDIRMQALDF